VRWAAIKLQNVVGVGEKNLVSIQCWVTIEAKFVNPRHHTTVMYHVSQ
jgi:hypothetical protein